MIALVMSVVSCGMVLAQNYGDKPAGEGFDQNRRGKGNFNYPVSKKMSNPLFVEFDSPMYGRDDVGPLYTADASAHVWNIDGEDVLFIYASHDMEPARGCDRMDRYHVFSTRDMQTWTDHGEILNADDVRRQSGIGSDGFMWAPDCAYNPIDKMYYFYFPHPESNETWNTSWRIGVCTSKHPNRDFKFIGWIDGMPPYIDPCVFVDDDGQPYIYNGGSAKCFGGKLKRDDWTKLDGEMQPMIGLEDFHEATWIHRHKGKYYLSYSDNNNGREGNHMCYAMSDSPLGPWKSMGIYMYPTGYETNHGSIVEFKGKYYAFYHTGNYSGRGNLRSVCVDELEYNPDGTIKIVQNYGKPYRKVKLKSDRKTLVEAEHYNKGGYHYGYFKSPASSSCGNNRKLRQKDVQMSIQTDDDRTYLKRMCASEWTRYTVAVEDSLLWQAALWVRNTGNKPAKIRLSSNGHNVSGELTVENDGWHEIVIPPFSLPKGNQYLEFRVDDGAVDFDSMTISPIETQ